MEKDENLELSYNLTQLYFREFSCQWYHIPSDKPPYMILNPIVKLRYEIDNKIREQIEDFKKHKLIKLPIRLFKFEILSKSFQDIIRVNFPEIYKKVKELKENSDKKWESKSKKKKKK